ncbi:unnamed protein product [Paramecium pentaurelia]|uniref:Uncharacterized protein n=1 Tax=Paramecium pentaurelia TaxID=43138 RepID=A0A8S1THL3_9CILI|nr:unnamed protein product [Paramecium pentaurelia]
MVVSETVCGNCENRRCSDNKNIGKQCSFLKRTDHTCQKFTTNDGPYKKSAVSACPVACTSKFVMKLLKHLQQNDNVQIIIKLVKHQVQDVNIVLDMEITLLKHHVNGQNLTIYMSSLICNSNYKMKHATLGLLDAISGNSALCLKNSIGISCLPISGIYYHNKKMSCQCTFDGYQNINAKITEHKIMQMVLTYQHMLIGVPLLFQIEPNLLIKEFVLYIQSLQIVIMKVLMKVVDGLKHSVY